MYSIIDLKNGFFHVPVEKKSVKYTSFVVPNGQYEFLRMPFGLCNTPSVFQRFINVAFANHISRGEALAYLDDLIIPSIGYEDGLQNLKAVLKTASEYGLLLN